MIRSFVAAVTLLISVSSGWAQGGGIIGGGGGTPGGSTTYLQYNNAGAFGGTNNLAYNSAKTSLYSPAGNLNLQSADGNSVAFVQSGNSGVDTNLFISGQAGYNTSITMIANTGSASGDPANSFNIKMNGAADGMIIRDTNTFRWAFNRAGLLQAASSTSSNPAFKPSGAIMQTRLADDSGFAPHEARTFQNGLIYSAAGTAIPTCNSGAEGTYASVSDGTAAWVSAVAYASGGSVHAPVYCDGTSWKYD